MVEKALTKAKNAKIIINVAKTKNTGLKRKPETLIQPAASGKHIASVLDTPYAKNGAVIKPNTISPTDFSCRLNNLSFIFANFVLLIELIYFSIMNPFSQFRTLEELVNCLSKERKLLRDIFGDRKTHVYSMDLAMELVEHRRERIQYLINYGVIHESGNFLELEDIYLKFFEEVLDVNEEIKKNVLIP